MNAFGLSEGTIITMDEAEERGLDDGRRLHVVPFYRWFLTYN